MSATEHRQAENLLERLPLVTYTLQRAAPSPLVFVSPQMEQVLGYRRDEFASDDFWLSRIVEEDRAAFRLGLASLQAGGDVMAVEYRVRTAAGEPMWVRDIASAYRDEIHGYLLDISREKQLEHELARERATLDAFFRDSAVGLAITDGDGRYLRMNDALAGWVGIPTADFIGRRLDEVAPQLAAEVVHGIETGRLFELELDTNGRVGLVSHFPFTVDGELHHGRIVADVTEERRAQAAEQRYKHALEQLPLVVYVNSVAPRRATYVSAYIEELTGYSPAEFLADEELGDRIIHPDDFAEIVERERASRVRGEVFEHEYRIVRADGEVRWVLDRMETILDDDGTELYEQGFLVDVTETRETAALLRAVWDGALDAMVIADDDGRYVDANPAACHLFGRPRGELVGRSVAEVTENGGDRWSDFRASGRSDSDSVVVRPDGERRAVEGTARADVMPGRHLAVLRDVTERKALEREVWRAHKLETVGRLAGGVAHDFNNLLTAIRGYAQLLQARVPAESVEAHHAAEIDRVADRAAALTAQLLALGRRQTLRPRPLDLNRLLEEHQDTFVEAAGARVELGFEPDPSLRAVHVDRTLLVQAIAHLVVNAAEAMPDGGRVVLRTRNEDVEARDDLADGRYVVVEVEDGGRGLDEASLEHLFEPFFTTKEVGSGSGLGLASAYGTVKQSGGTIRVATEVGVGSTFSVYLPAAETAGQTVLVVERDPAVRDVVFQVLTDASFRVLTSRTTVEAIRLAERFDGPIDLLLTDLDEHREASLAAALRGRRPSLRTLSLAKPYTPDRLQGAVRDELGSPEWGTGIPASR